MERMKTKVFLLTALLLSVAVSGFAADNIKGLGNLITKDIEIEDFDDIEISGPVEFNYEQSEDAPALSVTIDENLISFLKIETKDRKLTINVMKKVTIVPTKYVIKANSKWLKKAEVSSTGGFYVNSPLTGSVLDLKGAGGGLVQLKGTVKIGMLNLSSSNAGNIVADDVASEELECKVNGSGSITVKGGVPKATYIISGSGVINAYDCPSPEVKCDIKGSGVAKVHSTDNMKVNILGSGNVFYKGNTNVTQKVIGSGKVEPNK